MLHIVWLSTPSKNQFVLREGHLYLAAKKFELFFD